MKMVWSPQLSTTRHITAAQCEDTEAFRIRNDKSAYHPVLFYILECVQQAHGFVNTTAHIIVQHLHCLE